MMLVKTKLDRSKIEGIGLFANEDIPAGAPIWQFTPGLDLEVEPSQIADLSAPAREQLEKYTYISKVSGKHILCFDDARFFNHDPDPNVDCKYSPGATGEELDLCRAKRDIKKGEELTCNYNEFDAEGF